MAEDRLDRIEAILANHAATMADFDRRLGALAEAQTRSNEDFDKRLAKSSEDFDKRLTKSNEDFEKRLAKGDEVFYKRMAALAARDEALSARLEALAERHEALSQSVEMLVQSWFRRPPDTNRGENAA